MSDTKEIKVDNCKILVNESTEKWIREIVRDEVKKAVQHNVGGIALILANELNKYKF